MSISQKLRERVIRWAGGRCAYCHSSQEHVMAALEIDHIHPTALGGTDCEDNLCIACPLCNTYKAAQVATYDPTTGVLTPLYNPRAQDWYDHFTWSEDGTMVVGLTQCGRATVKALQLNNAVAMIVRRKWVAAGWHPPPRSSS